MATTTTNAGSASGVEQRRLYDTGWCLEAPEEDTPDDDEANRVGARAPPTLPAPTSETIREVHSHDRVEVTLTSRRVTERPEYRWYLRRVLLLVVPLALLLGTAGIGLPHDDDDERDGGSRGRTNESRGPGRGAESENMKLVGFNDLQARSAYQPVIHQQGSRWIAYVGHHGGSALNPMTGVVENNGTSIVDVTNPRRPRYLKHLPGPSGEGEAGGAQMVRICDGGGPNGLPLGVSGRTYMLRSQGEIAHQVWDVTNPSNPVLVSTPVEGLDGTHKSWWECNTGIAYLVSGLPGWRTNRMTQVFDLSNPAVPRHIRDYGLVGQQPGSTGPVPQSLHGPISTGPPPGIRGVANRIYFGHGTGSNGILQIVDRLKLIDPATNGCPPSGPNFRTNPTAADLLCPQLGRLDTSPTMGAHTVYPLLRQTVPEFVPNLGGPVRDIIVLVNEAGGGSGAGRCTGNRQLVYMVDITTESTPMGVANFQVPEASGDFCNRGGRFGAHASNENFTPLYYGKLVFVSWFNAGVRAIDVRDPWSPREAGFYIPATTAKTDIRCTTIPVNGVPTEICNFAIQTNNVEVDDRGLIYAVDRANTGMHILKLTGSAAKIAGLPDDDD
jgi:hypothetical protein